MPNSNATSEHYNIKLDFQPKDRINVPHVKTNWVERFFFYIPLLILYIDRRMLKQMLIKL
jgi:hypothetical protein